MSKLLVLSIALVTLAFSGKAYFAEAPEGEHSSSHAFLQQREFIGVDKCKTCHRKAEDGEQYRLWQEGPHAKAYTVLATAKAKEYGAARGIDNPQTSGECLQCHVTAYGVDAKYLGEKYTVEDGVGCESCHGAGGDYYKKSTMEGITKGTISAESVGLIQPSEQLCRGCHNEKSPGFKGFNFEEAKKKIAHPIPKAK